MRIAKSIQDNGIFSFFKNEIKHDFSGSIAIVEGGNAMIRFGVNDTDKLPIQLGEQVTLFANLKENCQCIFTDCMLVASPELEKGKAIIKVGVCFLDINVALMEYLIECGQTGQPFVLSELQFCFDNIAAWADKKSHVFNRVLDEINNKLTISYDIKTKIPLYENDTFQVNVGFFYMSGIEQIIDRTKIDIFERPYIHIKAINGNTFEINALLHILYQLASWINLSVGVPVSIDNVKAIFPYQDKRYICQAIFASAPFVQPTYLLTNTEIGISLKDLQQLQLDYGVLSSWFDNFDRVSPSLGLFLQYKTIANTNVEMQFLILTQSIEILANRLHPDKKNPFNTLLKGLFDSINNILHLDFSKSDINEYKTAILTYKNSTSLVNPTNNAEMNHQLLVYAYILELLLTVYFLKQSGIPNGHLTKLFCKSHKQVASLLPIVQYQLKHYAKKDKDLKKPA